MKTKYIPQKFNKGDIVEGSKRRKKEAKHYIVYLEKNDDGSFIGAVLTHSHSKKYKDNILMRQELFEIIDKNGEAYNFQFNNTYVVKVKFIKPFNWGPYEKIGQLTLLGNKFISSNLKNKEPMLWDDYIANKKQKN